MSGVEDAGTPGTQQDEKKPLDGAGGGHINLKVKGQVTASLLSSRLISSRELLFVQGFSELMRGFWLRIRVFSVWFRGCLCDAISQGRNFYSGSIR
jgi:hypothetical protein